MSIANASCRGKEARVQKREMGWRGGLLLSLIMGPFRSQRTGQNVATTDLAQKKLQKQQWNFHVLFCGNCLNLNYTTFDANYYTLLLLQIYAGF